MIEPLTKPVKIRFKGCFFDDEWEFEGPCILYAPVNRYASSGNSGGVDDLVEDVAIDLCLGQTPKPSFSQSDLHEFKWRGWNPKNFKKRTGARHVEILMEFFKDAEGEWTMRTLERKERLGLTGVWEHEELNVK